MSPFVTFLMTRDRSRYLLVGTASTCSGCAPSKVAYSVAVILNSDGNTGLLVDFCAAAGKMNPRSNTRAKFFKNVMDLSCGNFPGFGRAKIAKNLGLAKDFPPFTGLQ